jgi:hypothetical protein
LPKSIAAKNRLHVVRPSQTSGWAAISSDDVDRGDVMRWRVLLGVTGTDGVSRTKAASETSHTAVTANMERTVKTAQESVAFAGASAGPLSLRRMRSSPDGRIRSQVARSRNYSASAKALGDVQLSSTVEFDVN